MGGAATVGRSGGTAAGLALKPMLAWRMLRREVQAVECALTESLEAGRERLAMLVSRDTSRAQRE